MSTWYNRALGIELKRFQANPNRYFVVMNTNHYFLVGARDEIVDAIMRFAERGLYPGGEDGVDYAHPNVRRIPRIVSLSFEYNIKDKGWEPLCIDQEIVPEWRGQYTVGFGISPVRVLDWQTSQDVKRTFIQDCVESMIEYLIMEKLKECV